MSTQLVVVTFLDDLPQFEVMLHCLNQYWIEEKNITICCTDSRDHIKDIVGKILGSSWNIYFYPELQLNCSGYHQQQIYKIKASIDLPFDDSIVFDSKDFLLKETTINDFKNQTTNKYSQFFDSSKNFVDIYPAVSDLGIPLDNLPLPLILTPWIWSKKQLECYWEYLNSKFGHYSTWKEIPAGSEWAGYFAYTQNKNSAIFDTTTPYWMPIGGVWKGQADYEIVEQLEKFDQFQDRKVWKHHRAVTDLFAVNITANALKLHDIKESVINRWILHYML